jgi:hypothetical protein
MARPESRIIAGAKLRKCCGNLIVWVEAFGRLPAFTPPARRY